MCKYTWCKCNKSDFSELMAPFTWRIAPRPKNYQQIISWAAKEYENNLKRYYDADKYWPPKRLGREEALLRAARSTDVCPDDLARHVNSDTYHNANYT